MSRGSPVRVRWALVGCVAALAPQPGLAQAQPFPLGSPPMCEPSAAVRAPWDPALVLVGDNEVDSDLFGFRLGPDGRLVPARVFAMPGPSKAAPHDVEALAVVADRVLVVGSASRNAACKLKPGRQRLRLVRFDAGTDRLVEAGSIDAAPALAEASRGPGPCLRHLFTTPPPPGAAEFCQALSTADPCVAPNIEAAFGEVGPDPRVWLGLRAPLVDSAAVLVRLVPGLATFRFDAVVFVDLRDRGLRDATAGAALVWFIAGPVSDTHDGFSLVSVAPPPWRSGDRLAVTREIPLPASSEGLVVDAFASLASIVIDGDRGPGGSPPSTPCTVPGTQVVVPLGPPL